MVKERFQNIGLWEEHKTPDSQGHKVCIRDRKVVLGSQSPWATEAYARNIKTDPLSGWT